MMMARSICSAFFISVVLGTVCPDTRPQGYYSKAQIDRGDNSVAMTNGLPSGFTKLGSQMTTCELYELQQYCVEELSKFRAGAGKPFSDGRYRDPSIDGQPASLTPFTMMDTPMLQCMNERALSDLAYSTQCGHHSYPLKCGHTFSGGSAENSCCPRSCNSLAGCKRTLDGCLQQMWDEGEIVLDSGSAAWSSAIGHYLAMIGSRTQVVCGFGFDDSGKMLSIQNFFGDGARDQPCTYQCGTEQNDECGSCAGVDYCTQDSDCNDAPYCYKSPGTCTPPVCDYNELEELCPAGVCREGGVCEQNCADSANCEMCSTEAFDGCVECKEDSGKVLEDGCCVDACVTLQGNRFSGTYLQVGTYAGEPAYYSAESGRYLQMYCCGWGWSIVANIGSGVSVYLKSEMTGDLLESSGSWSGDSSMQVSKCYANCLGDNITCTTPPECYKLPGSCGGCGCRYAIDEGASCRGDGVCGADGVCSSQRQGGQPIDNDPSSSDTTASTCSSLVIILVSVALSSNLLL